VVFVLCLLEKNNSFNGLFYISTYNRQNARNFVCFCWIIVLCAGVLFLLLSTFKTLDWGGDSSVVECLPLKRKVGYSIRDH